MPSMQNNNSTLTGIYYFTRPTKSALISKDVSSISILEFVDLTNKNKVQDQKR